MVHQELAATRSPRLGWVLRVRTGILLTSQQCNRHAAIRKNLATSGFCELTDSVGRVNWYDTLDHSGRAGVNSSLAHARRAMKDFTSKARTPI